MQGPTQGRHAPADASELPGETETLRLLALQAALPCLLYAAPDASREPPGASTLELRGGTDAAMAPSISYLQHVLLPTLRRLCGLTLDLQASLTRSTSSCVEATGAVTVAPSVDDLHSDLPPKLRRPTGLRPLHLMALPWLVLIPSGLAKVKSLPSCLLSCQGGMLLLSAALQ